MARHKYLPRDDDLKIFDAKTSGWLTIGSTNGDYDVDLGVADHDEADPGVVVVMITGMTSGGSATVALALQDSADDSSYAALTPVPIAIAATAFDNALWADTLYLPLPDFGVRRYLRLVVTVAGADLTAGTISAWYTKRHA